MQPFEPCPDCAPPDFPSVTRRQFVKTVGVAVGRRFDGCAAGKIVGRTVRLKAVGESREEAVSVALTRPTAEDLLPLGLHG